MSASVSLDAQNGTPRCRVEGILDFETAQQVLNEVITHIQAHAALDVDLSGVTKSNSAGLALLIEWLGTARRSNHAVTFHHIPDGLRQLAVVCQVDALI